jgi:hypothetical protein
MTAALAHDVIRVTRGWSTEEEEEYVRQYVLEVTAHEVGHTLGLRHNFIASARYDVETLVDWTEDHQRVGTSVMDYNPPVIADEGKTQGPYLPIVAGTYDHHAIEYGYRVYESPEAEAEGLEGLASQWADPDLMFATDEDAGFGGANMDPRVSRYDFSSDPLAFLGRNVELTHVLWENLGGLVEDGESYWTLRNAFDRSWRAFATAGMVAGKTIGGVYQSRAHQGDEGGGLPFQPVPAAEQRRALTLVAEQLWAPGTYTLPDGLLAKLQFNQIGDLEWSNFSAPRQDYPLHEMVAQVQRVPLDLMFHPARLARMVDLAEMTEDTLSVEELFVTIRGAIWSDVGRGAIDSHRRDLQLAHVAHLGALVLGKSEGAPSDAVSLARLELAELQALSARMAIRTGDRTSKAHLMRIRDEVAKVLGAEIALD